MFLHEHFCTSYQGERWNFPHQAPGKKPLGQPLEVQTARSGNSPNDGFGCFVGRNSPEMHRIIQFMIREIPEIEYTKYSNSSVVWENVSDNLPRIVLIFWPVDSLLV